MHHANAHVKKVYAIDTPETVEHMRKEIIRKQLDIDEEWADKQEELIAMIK